MAISKDQIKTQYPLPAYNYRVTILPANVGSLPAGADLAGLGTSIACSEVSGLSMEVETVTYQHGFSFLTGFHVIPGQRKEVKLTIKKGITASSSYFSDWIKLIYPLVAPKPIGLMRKRDILVDLCDETASPVVRWIVSKALPTRLEAPTFDATTNEVAFERLELVAHQLKVDFVNSNVI